MAEWFAKSNVKWFRSLAEESLVEAKKLSPSKDKEETAAAFWERVEKAGLLLKALELYDEFAEENAEWVHRPRETKKKFAERIEREGRQTEVERMRQELLEDGYPLREIQERLVCRFQPLDGTDTRPWKTPDPWENGRLFRKKESQERLLAQANPDDQEDDEQKAKWLVECAQWRREERVALANARRRARESIAQARVSVVKEESGACEVGVSPKRTSKEEPSVAASK